MRRTTRAVLVFLFVLGCLAADHSGSAQASTSVPPTVTAAAKTTTSLAVKWTAPANATRWWVIVTSADDRSVGQRTACGSCRSLTVEHLAPGSTYFVRVVGIDSTGAFGAFSNPVRVSTPVPGSCSAVPANATCALVDVTTPVGPATGVGTDLLHGVTSGTSPSRVTATDPRGWRVSSGDTARFALARQYGAPVTVLLSDGWMSGTGSLAPWSNWDFYRWWVGQVVTAYKNANLLPDYWEVQNEPLPTAYQGGSAATAQLVQQQFDVASDAIHQVLPSAKVIGPSAGYVSFGSGLADVDSFLAQAVSTGHPAGEVTWHEIGAGCLGYCDGSPRAVLQHADDVRAAEQRSGAGAVPLDVNEWGAPWNFQQPGASVGYLSSLAYAGVDRAGRACWPAVVGSATVDTCFSQPGTLDGLLMPDGTTPTDAWWVQKAYADMTGPGTQLLSSSIDDPEASTIATVDGSGTVRILIGRHTGCQVGIDANCPGATYAPAKTVQPLLRFPTRRTYVETVQRIPSVAGALASPQTVGAPTTVTGTSTTSIGSWSIGDGEALLITLTPR